MIRVYKKDVVAALNESELYASSFVRKYEGEKLSLKQLKVCLVGEVLRRSKSFSSIEEFQEYCRDVRVPTYELGFRQMIREEHKHSKKLTPAGDFSPIIYVPKEHRTLVIDFLTEKNLHLSLISSEFEHCMEDQDFDKHASVEVKKKVLDFIQINVPELVKES